MLSKKSSSMPVTATPIDALFPDMIELMRFSRESSDLQKAKEENDIIRTNEMNFAENLKDFCFISAPE